MHSVQQIIAAALLAVAASTPMTAMATVPAGTMVSYRYTGNPLDFQQTNSDPAVSSSGRPIIGEFFFSDYIAPDTTITANPFTSTTPKFLSARSDSSVFFDYRYSMPRWGANITLTTDANGEVAAWNFSLGYSGPGGSGSDNSRFGNGSTGKDQTLGNFDGALDARWNEGKPGTWTVSVVPVPEPETYALAMAGMLIVASATRRKSSLEA